MEKEKRTTLIIEFTDEEYRLLSEISFDRGYCCVEELVKQTLIQYANGGENEANTDRNARKCF
jgi:hypothetical protein